MGCRVTFCSQPRAAPRAEAIRGRSAAQCGRRGPADEVETTTEVQLSTPAAVFGPALDPAEPIDLGTDDPARGGGPARACSRISSPSRRGAGTPSRRTTPRPRSRVRRSGCVVRLVIFTSATAVPTSTRSAPHPLPSWSGRQRRPVGPCSSTMCAGTGGEWPLDFRGHGESDPAEDGDYSVASLASDVAAVAEQLSLRRFFLAGHSLGAAVAIEYASHHPERVAGLLLVDPQRRSEPAAGERVGAIPGVSARRSAGGARILLPPARGGRRPRRRRLGAGGPAPHP